MPYTSSDTSTRRATIRGGIQTRPLEYKPNSEMFMNVINTLNERQEKIKDVETSIADSINKLNLNPQEQEFRNKKIREYSDMIKANPMSLINAKDAARKLADDKQLLGRARYQEKFEEITKSVTDRNDITTDTKEWWLANHKYDYKETVDSNGDIISNEYNPTDMPYKDIEWEDAFASMSRAIGVSSTSSSRSSHWNRDGNGGESSRSSSFSELSADSINKMVNEWAKNHTSEINQAREVASFKYNKLTKQLEALQKEINMLPPNAESLTEKENQLASIRQQLEKLRTVNGMDALGNVDFDKFVKTHIDESKFAKLMAYKHTGSSSTTGSSVTTKKSTDEDNTGQDTSKDDTFIGKRVKRYGNDNKPVTGPDRELKKQQN